MNIVAEQLANSPTIQLFLAKFLEYIANFFRKSKANLSQEKTYQKLKQITQLIHAYFPQRDILINVYHKVAAIVRMKIDDKFEGEKNSELNQNQNLDVIEQMMKQFNRKSSMQSQNKPNSKRKVNQQWLKKLLIDELESLRQDIQDNQGLFKQNLVKILKQNIKGTQPLKCLLLDSSLNHTAIFQSLDKSSQLSLITQMILTQSSSFKSEKLNCINIKDISSKIQKCDIVLISSDSLLKNGGVLVPSGGLMVALSARSFNKPVYILSRSYCLTQKVMIDQKNTNNLTNPLKYFKNGQQNPNKVYIAKKYDFLDATLIKQILTQFIPCEPVNVSTIFEEYYENI